MIKETFDKLVSILDGWHNSLTAMGGSYDPWENISWMKNNPLSQEMLHQLYMYEWVSRRAVNIFPQFATRKFIEFKGDPEYIDKITEEVQRLDLRKKVLEAAIGARLYGGSVIFPIVGDENDDLSEEVNEFIKEKEEDGQE